MPRFTFIARNMKGNVVKDSLEAASTQEARAFLVEQGLLVEELHESTGNEPTLDAVSSRSSFPAWTTVDEPHTAPSVPLTEGEQETHRGIYFPFLETLRLYAGWLVAWYMAIYAIGYYQQTRSLPFALSYIENLYKSPLVLSFTLGSFLFLLLSALHKFLGKGKILGFILFIVGIILFLAYRQSLNS